MGKRLKLSEVIAAGLAGLSGLHVEDSVEAEELVAVSASVIDNANDNIVSKLDFLEEREVAIFANMLRNVEDGTELIKNTHSQFRLKFHYKGRNSEEYHLWLGEPNATSSLVLFENETMVYTVSNEVTNQLRLLLKRVH